MSVFALERRELVRTTVDLPAGLLREAEQAVKRGVARSRNALVALALEAYLRDLEEQWIDAEFALMADDPRYQEEMEQIAQEFGPADWEALRTAEGACDPPLDDAPAPAKEGGSR